MRYTVIWLPDTLNELADVWLRAFDREAVSAASAEVDRLLGYDPVSQGESREDNTRVLLIKPLGIEFEINDGDRKVIVNSVWNID